MSNPYSSPASVPGSPNSQAAVQGPALALIIVSSIAIAVGGLALVGDVLLLASGAIERLEEVNDGPVSKYTTVIIRTIWGILLIVASVFVLYGALQMKKMTNYGTAKAAAVVASIPLLGPCCLLGIPFGIWALVVLGKPGVKEAFR